MVTMKLFSRSTMYTISFLTFLLILTGLIVAFRQPLLPLIYRSNPKLVTMAFWNSLHKNDKATALGIVSASHRMFIEDWIENHKVIDCSYSPSGGPTSIGRFENDGKWHASIWYACTAQTGEPYCLAIDDIIVEKTNMGWLVIDWNRITETCE